jgi:hypothetical protein
LEKSLRYFEWKKLMNTDNVWIVVLLVLGIVVLANLFMFAMVRGSRSMKFDWFKNTGDTLGQPFKKGNDKLGELRQRVGELSEQEEKDKK